MNHERLLAQLQRSGKYAQIDKKALGRVVAQYLPRYSRESEALAAIKAHLHSVYGAYLPKGSHGEADKLLAACALLEPTPENEQALSRKLLALHTSTAERLPILEPLYTFVFAHLRSPSSIIDLGCGFNPFAWPLIPLNPCIDYLAGDLSPATAALLTRFFAWTGRAGQAKVIDAMAPGPLPKADAAFLMKLLPLLEQQQKGAGMALLHALPVNQAVVTFPTASLSGRRKGMRDYYGNWLETNLSQGWQPLCSQEFGNELVYILTRDGPVPSKEALP